MPIYFKGLPVSGAVCPYSLEPRKLFSLFAPLVNHWEVHQWFCVGMLVWPSTTVGHHQICLDQDPKTWGWLVLHFDQPTINSYFIVHPSLFFCIPSCPWWSVSKPARHMCWYSGRAENQSGSIRTQLNQRLSSAEPWQPSDPCQVPGTPRVQRQYWSWNHEKHFK